MDDDFGWLIWLLLSPLGQVFLEGVAVSSGHYARLITLLPDGMVDHKLKDPKNYTLDEWQAAQRKGIQAILRQAKGFPFGEIYTGFLCAFFF